MGVRDGHLGVRWSRQEVKRHWRVIKRMTKGTVMPREYKGEGDGGKEGQRGEGSGRSGY